VWDDTLLEQRQQLVLGTVKASHAGVGFGPDDEIERLEAELGRRSMDRRLTAPIDEGAKDAAIAEKGKHASDPSLVEGEELRVGHFARRHGELAVLAACGMTCYRHVVGLVGQNELSLGFAIHQKT
jgi:hypothetical protein